MAKILAHNWINFNFMIEFQFNSFENYKLIYFMDLLEMGFC